MDLMDSSGRSFVRALSSGAATPGGGGASALAAALGAALAGMVANLTLGKPKYAAVQSQTQALLARAEALREALLDCVEADAQAFAPVMDAYALAKDDARRAAALETALKGAAAVPLQILELSCEAIALHSELAEIGSAMALSDVASGAALCRGALFAAAANVKVNTRLLRDRDHAAALDARVDACIAEYGALADAVYARAAQR